MTLGTSEIGDIKHGDSYENDASEPSNTQTVMMIVTCTLTIPVTVRTFQRLGIRVRGPYHGGATDTATQEHYDILGNIS